MLSTCWQCGHTASTRAVVCPNPECALEQPWDHEGHARRKAARAAPATEGAAVPAQGEAHIRELVAQLRADEDPRTHEEVLGRPSHCPECKLSAPISTFLGQACPQCGNTFVVDCEMPGAPCPRSAVRMQRVSG